MSAHSRQEIASGHEATSREVAAHPVEHERPEDWGWHHEWRRSAPVIGWVMTIVMALMVFGNDRGDSSTVWLLGIAAVMAFMLIRDRIRRKNSWRS